MANKAVRLLCRIFLGGRRDPSPEDKRHESNLLWGPIAIGCSIVLTVIAAMKHDLRFLLWLAWPCFVFGAWHLSRKIPYRALSIWMTVATALMVAVGLYRLGIWLAPPIDRGTPSTPFKGNGDGNRQQNEAAGKTLPSTQSPSDGPKTARNSPASPQSKDIQPEVTLRFVTPDYPSLLLVNSSRATARDLKWEVLLWNADMPDRNDPLPILISTFDWIKPNSAGGPMNLFGNPSVASLVKSGDHLFGSASVDCPTCVRSSTYFVYITFGEGGWFTEVKEKMIHDMGATLNEDLRSSGALYPAHFTRAEREKFLRLLENIPESEREPIR